MPLTYTSDIDIDAARPVGLFETTVTLRVRHHATDLSRYPEQQALIDAITTCPTIVGMGFSGFTAPDCLFCSAPVAYRAGGTFGAERVPGRDIAGPILDALFGGRFCGITLHGTNLVKACRTPGPVLISSAFMMDVGTVVSYLSETHVRDAMDYLAEDASFIPGSSRGRVVGGWIYAQNPVTIYTPRPRSAHEQLRQMSAIQSRLDVIAGMVMQDAGIPGLAPEFRLRLKLGTPPRLRAG